jgi:hypothetical protein
MNELSINRTSQASWWFTPIGLLLLAGILSSAAAWWLIAAPVALLANTAKHAGHFAYVYVHMIGGTIMLVLGAANLYIGATRNYFRYHRIVGISYLGGGSVGALIALLLALASPHHDNKMSLVIRIDEISNIGASTSTLALAWLATAALAFRAIRSRRIETHRDWVIRSYVLAWSFVLCRLVGMVPAIADFGEGTAIIWLSWIVPLFLCEVGVQWKNGALRSAVL